MPAQPIALALVCKTPQAGQSKTRLSPPLTPQQCAELSAAFIRDVSATMQEAARNGSACNYAVYAPAGSAPALRSSLPADFRLLAQSEGDLGRRLIAAMRALLAAGHRGVIFINADGPTLPLSILREAVERVGKGEHVVGPALDGGYTLIGMPAAREALFTDIAWSTPVVLAQTKARAASLGVSLRELPLWYDIDDAQSLAILRSDLAGGALPFARDGLSGAPAPATRSCLEKFDGARISLVS